MDKSYKKIAEYYNKAFIEYGDTPEGLAWDNQLNLDKRYEVMFNVVKHYNTSILDFGCGYGGLYEWILNNKKTAEYVGLDINKEAIKFAKEKHPETTWIESDIHKDTLQTDFDYIICNGTFTVKDTLTQDEMWDFMTSTLEKLWTKTNKGIAFNIMSKLVDWERDDLFHVSMDQLGQWLKDNLSRNFVIRNDYGLYEYTFYVYKN
jgi:methylase of polypeptide subunit release factors